MGRPSESKNKNCRASPGSFVYGRKLFAVVKKRLKFLRKLASRVEDVVSAYRESISIVFRSPLKNSAAAVEVFEDARSMRVPGSDAILGRTQRRESVRVVSVRNCRQIERITWK